VQLIINLVLNFKSKKIIEDIHNVVYFSEIYNISTFYFHKHNDFKYFFYFVLLYSPKPAGHTFDNIGTYMVFNSSQFISKLQKTIRNHENNKNKMLKCQNFQKNKLQNSS
jgi:hypothetical protein